MDKYTCGLTMSFSPAGRDTHNVFPDVPHRQTHWRHLASETDGGRELEQGDIIIEGDICVLGMHEDLRDLVSALCRFPLPQLVLANHYLEDGRTIWIFFSTNEHKKVFNRINANQY